MGEKNLQKGLEHDALVIKERVPEQVTEEKIKHVAASLRAFMAEHCLSRSKVAKLLGVSRSMVNQFLGSGYKGNICKLINRIVNLINSVDRKGRADKQRPFVEITVAKLIGTLVTQTEAFSIDEGRIGLIIGDGGHGKVSVCSNMPGQIKIRYISNSMRQ